MNRQTDRATDHRGRRNLALAARVAVFAMTTTARATSIHKVRRDVRGGKRGDGTVASERSAGQIRPTFGQAEATRRLRALQDLRVLACSVGARELMRTLVAGSV